MERCSSRSKDLVIQEYRKIHQLESYYKEVNDVILQYQSHTLGLFPRGQSKHARVRDNIYCAMSLWALALAFRHVGFDHGRSYEIEQSAVKCMRGILFCYMRQANKVEQFKKQQMWKNALHARYDYITGDPVTDDSGWGHLQIDGTSLFLLVLAQMIASGVQVIFTKDEVDFIQNLVYYVERAYRTPDFGMWERGSRENIGRRELHASSIGMAKAALNAIHGLNLFGEGGSPFMTIHVDPDAQYRNHVILSTLLPKESCSKETDAALLCITGFPSFSIEDKALREQTEEKVKSTLEGRYGFKRFNKDGHHTLLEDTKRRHYEAMELEAFEGIECEWPLFYLYAFITAMFRGNQKEADEYWGKLQNTFRQQTTIGGYCVVPKLYFYSECKVSDNDELVSGSSSTISNIEILDDIKLEPLQESMPFLWAQALYLIARLIRDHLITPVELDPLGLHLPVTHTRYIPAKQSVHFRSPSSDVLIQVALISESSRLQAILATYGIPTQTPKQIEPITLSSPGEVLLEVYSHLGENKKLGLSGRPLRPIGAIGTSKIYQIYGHLTVFYPTDLNIADFYMSFDIKLFIDTIKSIIRFLNSYWNINGRPTVTILLRQNLFQGGYFKDMIGFLAKLRSGEVDGITVRLDRLQALIPTSCVDSLDCVREEDDEIPKSAVNKSPRLRLRSLSIGRSSSSGSLTGDETFTVETLQLSRFEVTQDVPECEPDYGPAELNNRSSDDDLIALLESEDNLVGKLYLLRELIRRKDEKFTVNDISLVERIQDVYHEAAGRKHWMAVRLGASLLMKVVDCLAPSLSHMLVKEKEVSIGVFGYPEHIITEPLTPAEIIQIIYKQCMEYQPIEAVLQQELLIYLGDFITRSDMNTVFDGMIRFRLGWIIQAMKNELLRTGDDRLLYQLAPYDIKQLLRETLLNEDSSRSPLYKRQLDGALNRVPPGFYIKVYKILEKTSEGISVRGRTLPQHPTVQTMSAQEKTFSQEVEKLLSDITSPEYRQLAVELLMVVSTILERNPELKNQKCINLDELLQRAFTMLEDDVKNGLVRQPSTERLQTSEPFYSLSPCGPHGTVAYMAKAAITQLLLDGVEYDSKKTCSVS